MAPTTPPVPLIPTVLCIDGEPCQPGCAVPLIEHCLIDEWGECLMHNRALLGSVRHDWIIVGDRLHRAWLGLAESLVPVLRWLNRALDIVHANVYTTRSGSESPPDKSDMEEAP